MNTYLYSDLINDNYLYEKEYDYIKVFKNCVDNQCTCVNVYPQFDYLRGNEYNCNSSNIIGIPVSSFTDNIYYRIDFPNILFIFLVFCFVIIFCPLKILFRFFRRFDF